ncbi:MAG: PEGA domain-containing protein [Myxococcales bacterium]|nr:PEGA domain-containing protein [Myxococcales bacterium]
MRSVGLVVVLMSATAAAQDAPHPAERRVGVLVLGVTPADRALADALAEVLIAAVADSPGPARILVGKEELQAALGQDDEASLACLASASCLGRLGVQLSLDELVAATLGRREAGFAFDLGRHDPRTGDRLAHTFRDVDGVGEGELATALVAAYGELAHADGTRPPARGGDPQGGDPQHDPQGGDAAAVPELAALAELTVTFDPPHARVTIDGEPIDGPERLAAGRHVVRVDAEGYRGFERAIELRPGEQRVLDVHLAALPPLSPPQLRLDRALISSGAGAAAAGIGLALGFGLRSRARPAEGATRADAQRFVEGRERDARVANVGFVLAAVGAVTATVGALLWRRRSTPHLTPHVAFHPTGAFVALELRR